MPSAQQQTATMLNQLKLDEQLVNTNTSKTINNNNSGGNKTPQEQPEYVKQVLTIIEKKVRNLDKRRVSCNNNMIYLIFVE